MTLFEPGKPNETPPVQSYKVIAGVLALLVAAVAFIAIVYLMNDAGY